MPKKAKRPVNIRIHVVTIDHFRKGGAIIYIPKALTESRKFPFKERAWIKAKIVGGCIVLIPPEWWELLNWRKMHRTFEKLPDHIKQRLIEEGVLDV